MERFPNTNIHPNTKIADDVIIEPFTTIGEDVVIGKGTWIGPNVTIFNGARIGENCKIFPGAVISAIPQDLKFDNEYTTVEIGNNTVIRECVTIHRGTSDKMMTKVGDNCLIMGYVHIGHDSFIGNNCILANYVGISGHNVIEDYVIMEGKVGTQQFIRIGAHSFVAGGTLVRKNVPPYVRAAREPISYAGINAVGLRRRGFTDQQIKNIEDIYRNLYVLNNTIGSGVKSIEEELPDSPEKKQVLEFIELSDKGIMKGPI